MVVVTQLDTPQAHHITGLIRSLISPGRLWALVFHDCGFGLGFDLFFPDLMEDMTRLIGRCSPCDRVILKNCWMLDDPLEAFVAQHSFSVDLRDQIELQMWDLFETGLILRSPLNRPELAGWIAGCVAQFTENEDEPVRDLLVPTLRYYQSADPRPSSHFHECEWSKANISTLDVNQLTQLTAVALNESRRRLAF
ncbi:uncharacterized protein LOC129602851 [Paramacrobiotus metropolitanus]|uniref:uncharacterized protein LOC129602851 n=1 Tax=Paramacrobiotus metropolitanus TaxID=2943436 RepID=UPI0024460F37|nr:uncharacterized protein LOC129602851 [Paramacrobiotus metropolitanus]